jgi:anti-sigma B factor antagonist
VASEGMSLRDGTHDGRETLVLSGELDLNSAPRLEARVAELAGTRPAVILDLRELAFTDSTGLRAILRARDLCAEHRCDFGLIPGPPAVQRLFELTRLLDQLPFLAP